MHQEDVASQSLLRGLQKQTRGENGTRVLLWDVKLIMGNRESETFLYKRLYKGAVEKKTGKMQKIFRKVLSDEYTAIHFASAFFTQEKGCTLLLLMLFTFLFQFLFVLIKDVIDHALVLF